MRSSIATEKWFFVSILTQDSKKKAKATAEQVLTFFLFENNLMTRWNGPVLTLSYVIKFVMPSASEAELGAILITAQEMEAIRNTQEEMKWHKPK